MNSMLEVALSYAEEGYHVFPCRRDKRPYIEGWPERATTDSGTIREWWEKWPRANIGLPTGKINGFWVLDVDGEKGRGSLMRFMSDIPHDTPRVNTANGYHLYFEHIEGLSTNAGKVAEGLDIRTDGGFVVAAGSVHESGTVYEYANESREPVEAPESLVKAIREASERRPSFTAPVAAIPEGSRNSTLFSRARSLLKQGYDDTEAFALLDALNENRCESPLGEAELLQIVASAGKYERGELRVEEPGTNGYGPLNLANRVMLGESIEPPQVFERDILLSGKSHQFYAGAEQGKSWISLWLTKQAIERGQRVLYLDSENGRRIIDERLLGSLGLDRARSDELLFYYNFLTLDLKRESTQGYVHFLDGLSPDIVVFDSWAGFLADCGLDENSNTDVVNWSVKYIRPARQRGITTVILDHVPHEAKRSRGASRKRDEVDVQWSVSKVKHFDRKTVGEVEMRREKDREGYLPDKVRFSIGGSPFKCQRTDASTNIAPKLSPNADKLKTFLQGRGEQGAKWHEMEKLIGSKGSTSNAVVELQEHGYVRHEERKPYYYVEPNEGGGKPNGERFKRFNGGSNEPFEHRQHEEGSRGSHPHRGEPLNLDAEPFYPSDEDMEEVIAIWREQDS